MNIKSVVHVIAFLAASSVLADAPSVSNRVEALVGSPTPENRYFFAQKQTEQKFHDFLLKAVGEQCEPNNFTSQIIAGAFVCGAVLAEHHAVRDEPPAVVSAKWGRPVSEISVRLWMPVLQGHRPEWFTGAKPFGELWRYKDLSVWFTNGKVTAVTPPSGLFEKYLKQTYTLLTPEQKKQLLAEFKKMKDTQQEDGEATSQ